MRKSIAEIGWEAFCVTSYSKPAGVFSELHTEARLAWEAAANAIAERCASACEESGTDYSGQDTEDYCAAKIRAMKS